MFWIELVGVTAILSASLTVCLLSRKYHWHWGRVFGPAVGAGSGPYRAAETRQELPRGVPSVVRWAAATGVAWGVLTLLLFMPSGFLLLLILGQSAAGDLGMALGATLLLLVACDAIILGFALLAAAPAILRGGEDGERAGRGVARWSTAHHLAVLGTFAVFALSQPDGLFFLVFAFVPCLLGLAQAGMLHRAADLCPMAEPTAPILLDLEAADGDHLALRTSDPPSPAT